jgi:hypothetical protein
MSVDPSWKGFYKTGGTSFIIAGIIVLFFILANLILQQPLPPSPQAILENPMPPITIFAITVIGEFLLMFGFLGLYLSLKNVNKTNMLIATALGLGAVSMFLVSRGQIISLIPISSKYMVTSSTTLREAYLASATLAIEAQNTYSTMAMILLNLATIITGLTMLKGVFNKNIGYLAIIAGIITIFAPPLVIMGAPIIIPLIGLILTGIWNIVVGVKLYKIG